MVRSFTAKQQDTHPVAAVYSYGILWGAPGV